MHDGGDGACAPAARPMPFMKPRASSPRVDGTLITRASPVCSSSTNRSVNVPPTSTPTTRDCCVVAIVMPFLFLRGVRALT